MAVLHPDMEPGVSMAHTNYARPINADFARFLDVANQEIYLDCAAFLVQNGSDEECAIKCCNALRFVLGWRAKDPNMTDASPTDAELSRAARRLPPAWQFGEITDTCVKMARGAIDLVGSCASHPEILPTCQAAMEHPSDSPPVVMTQAAILLGAAGLVPPAQVAHDHDHAAGEPCPDPSRCDCAPCSAAKAGQKAPRAPAKAPPAWTQILGKMRLGRTDCATGTCPV